MVAVFNLSCLFIPVPSFPPVYNGCSLHSILPSFLSQHDRSLPRFLRRFTSLSLLVYMLSVMVELLQKLRQYEASVALLEELLGQDTHLQDHRGLWYTRLALNLHAHLRKPAKVGGGVCGDEW